MAVDPIQIAMMMGQKKGMEQAKSQVQSAPEIANPYQAYKDHPFLMGLSTLAMGVGEGMTGRPFLTNFNNNLYEQKQAQLKYKQWQKEQEAKAVEDASQAALRQAQIDAYKNGVPLITLGADGKPQVLGNVPKGSVVRQSPEAIVEIATRKAEIPTADMRNQLKTAEQAGSLIEELESQASSLKGGYEGMAKQAEAFISRGEGESGDYKMYEDNSKSAAVAFYRAVTGDTRLSDSDAADRAYPLMWKTNEAESLKPKKFGFLKRMIAARKELLSSGKYKAEDTIPFDVIKKQAISGSRPNGAKYYSESTGKWYDKDKKEIK